MAISWTLNNGVLTISGTGAMDNYTSGNYAPWYENRNSITSIIIKNGVTSIGNFAFYNCTALTNVTIPDSVTSIGELAFYSCTLLTSVTIPNNVTNIRPQTFYSCTALTNVTIPDSVTNIEIRAFANCTSLTSITIPDSVTNIDNYTFESCSSLTVFLVDENNQYYASDANGCLYNKNKTKLIQYPMGNQRTSFTIPDSVTNIILYAFSGCSSLTSVTIPNGVTNIGYRAFYNCTALTDVYYTGSETNWNAITISTNNEPLTNATIHYNYNPIIASGYCGGEDDGTNLSWTLNENGILTISGTGAMDDYDGGKLSPWNNNKNIITSIEIQNGVTTIGSYAFDETKISTMTFPNSITSIGYAAFGSCNELTNVTIPNSVTNIGIGTFSYCLALINISVTEDNQYYASDTNGCLYNKNKTELIQYPIGNIRTSFSIPNTVTSINDEAFYGCAALTDIIIPNNITSINSRTFSDCTSLTSITIPDSVTNIEYAAFDGSTALTDVYYTGNETDWNAITIDANNEPLINATIHYNLTYLVTKTELTSIANAIRAKAGTTSKYTWPNQMISAIEGLTIGSVVDWTGGGSINITSDKVLLDTYFYDNSGNLTQGNISIQQSTTGTVTTILSPSSFSNNGDPKTGYQHKKGYYNGIHYNKLKTSTPSIITITPSSSSQTITLYGSSATYNYFPYAITIESAITTENTDWIDNRSAISGAYSNSTITKINSGAFTYCSNLTQANFLNCTYIERQAFYYCTKLTSINFPNCETIDTSAFQFCSELTSANFPLCTEIKSSAFYSCYKLISADFPQCLYIDYVGFGYCSKLTSINFPKCKTISSYAFRYCRSLTTASFPRVSVIKDYAFHANYNLLYLYLNSTSLVSLAASNVFSSTPIAGYWNSSYYTGPTGQYGSIFVPASLVSAYKSSTNWTYYSARITSIKS